MLFALGAAAATTLALVALAWGGLFERLGRLARPAALVPVFIFTLLLGLLTTANGRRWLRHRVAPLSVEALSLFRVVFAFGLLLALHGTVPDLSTGIVGTVALAAFAAGVWPRAALTLFVASLTATVYPNVNSHDIALPLKTLWLLVLVPWTGAGASPRANGLAAWIPRAMLGVAYAAAAFAKLDEVGPAWITGGAVRFIFIADAGNAPVTWGRAVAASDTMSVIFSAGAVVAEALVIVAAVVPRGWAVALGGVLALALHTGFYLFQGVWWSWWWALLPVFLPWERFAGMLRAQYPPAAPAAVASSVDSRLPLTAAAVLMLALLQQPVASLFRVEYSFLVSDFPMYSNVFGIVSTKQEYAAYAESNYQPAPRLRFEPADGSDAATLASRLANLDANGVIAEAIRDSGSAAGPVERPELAALGARYRKAFGAPPPFEVSADRWRFDWNVANFAPREEWRRVASIDLAAGRVTPY